MKTHASRLHSERGSLLIVAMIMCAVIGISIASYIRLGLQSQKISNRALYNNGAMNIAEQGMEEAMYSINQMVNDATYTWPGWTSANGGADMQRKWTGYTFDQNSTGVARVYVQHYDGTIAPTIIARSTVTLGGASSAPIEKWIKVTLAMTSKFANGLVAKNNITFSGSNASVDSWNSDPDNNAATTAIKYSSTTRDDNGTVGSISVAVNSVGVNNADIWGYVATGGSPASVGPNGLVGPWGTANGTIAAGHSSTDFAASFDAVTFPTSVTVSGTTTPITYTPMGTINGTSSSDSLPGDSGASPAADGKYYIEAPAINFNNQTLNIEAGKTVVLKLTNTGTTASSAAISVGGGSGVISLASGAKLIVYTEGKIDIGGKGISNGVDSNSDGVISSSEMSQPVNFQIWGTKTSGTQPIDIAGNGALSAIVYAPQGSVKINGNGDVAGSIVANDITVVGNAAFHYDESLGNFGGNPFRVAAWTELTSASDRATYASYLSF
jgi:Tfp pilus assembly protein PilX